MSLLDRFSETITLLVPTIDEYDVWGRGTTYDRVEVPGVLVHSANDAREAPHQLYRDGTIKVHFPRSFTASLSQNRALRRGTVYQYLSEEEVTVTQNFTYNRAVIFQVLSEDGDE